MVIAALVCFAILVVAWMIAPSQPALSVVEPMPATPEAEPLAA